MIPPAQGKVFFTTTSTFNTISPICQQLTRQFLFMCLLLERGLIVSPLKKGDREDPGKNRGTCTTLVNLVGKLYSMVINDCLLRYLELNRLHEGQGTFRLGRSCTS